MSDRSDSLRALLIAKRRSIDYILNGLDKEEELPWTLGDLHELYNPLYLHGQLESIQEQLEAMRETIAHTARGTRCAFGESTGGPGDFARFMVASGQRSEGMRELRDFTHGAVKVTIIDPYLYGGDIAGAEQYVAELLKAIRADSGSLKTAVLIYSSRMGRTKEIRRGIRAALRKNGIRLREHDTDTIHDRIWIADDTRGLVVGTSLGGLGNRLAFMLDLPKHDLDALKEYLSTTLGKDWSQAIG